MSRTHNPTACGWHRRGREALYRRRWLPVGVRYDIDHDCWDLYWLWPRPWLIWRQWWRLEPWHIVRAEGR